MSSFSADVLNSGKAKQELEKEMKDLKAQLVDEVFHTGRLYYEIKRREEELALRDKKERELNDKFSAAQARFDKIMKESSAPALQPAPSMGEPQNGNTATEQVQR